MCDNPWNTFSAAYSRLPKLRAPRRPVNIQSTTGLLIVILKNNDSKCRKIIFKWLQPAAMLLHCVYTLLCFHFQISVISTRKQEWGGPSYTAILMDAEVVAFQKENLFSIIKLRLLALYWMLTSRNVFYNYWCRWIPKTWYLTLAEQEHDLLWH